MSTNTTLDVPGLAFQTLDEMGADYLKCLLHGPQGAGKTRLASTVARMGLTLFIDLVGEKGVQSFKGAPWAKNIRVVRPSSVQQLDDIYWQLAAGNHPYKAVIVDSLTSVQKQANRFVRGHSETEVREIRSGSAPTDLRTWGQTLDIITDLTTFMFNLADAEREKPMHVVMTAQTKLVENEDTGITTRTPDVQKGALSLVLASPAYVMYCETEDNPDAVADETLAPMNHIVRFGSHPGYRTKARVPYHLKDRVPPILGRTKSTPLDLTWLSQVLEIGGAPAPKKAAPAAPSTTEKEN